MNFIKEKRELVILVSLGILLLIGGIWDKQISQGVMNQGSLFGTFFQNYGLIFPGIIIFMSTQIFIYYAKESNLPHFGKGSIYFIAIIAGLYQIWQMIKIMLFYTVTSLNNSQKNQPIGAANNDGGGAMSFPNWFFPALVILSLLTFVVGSMLCNRWLKGKNQEELNKLVLVGLGAIVAVYASNTIIDVMKSLWGRFRPYELQNSWADYTNWWRINGANGHKSFPSGHSEQAWLALYLPLFVDPLKKNKRQKIVILTSVFGCFVAWSRVRIGAHFLSDVVVGSAIAIFVIYVVSRLLNQRLDGEALSE
ncbi:phosphatase PAP2 family protein [Enterococcus ureasiticus]|uniref:phosphatase PAP2 family protein n=1 Tax=Enterococcus ureasiticus TaxID=903984 RepID=UPI001A8CD085|nr:phosphatase PAP2 family protein [Enterococcus ureasiticus]MBO0473060.1 phosphatase PAP2 family protein [Enterococcus ureasiticus]